MQVMFLINNGHVNAWDYGMSWFEKIFDAQMELVEMRNKAMGK
jgi:hypothetical protein